MNLYKLLSQNYGRTIRYL